MKMVVGLWKIIGVCVFVRYERVFGDSLSLHRFLRISIFSVFSGVCRVSIVFCSILFSQFICS